jgi:DNA-binding transcriptional LysR family regulator
MDLLGALKTFVSVNETGSFTAVARRENSSQSAVTRRIAELETHFGIRLFHRTTRRLTLTPDGEHLLAHAHHVLQATDDMETALGFHRTDPVGHVRFGAPVGFGLFLAGQLPALLARHPALTVELVLHDETVDMVAARLDLAVRVRPLEDSSLVVRQIGQISWHVVASPGYIAKQGAPQRPQDLAGHSCLIHSTARGSRWHFVGPQGPMDVHVVGRFAANVVDSVRQAALAGFGIALLPDIMIADDLAAGRLVPILPGYETPRVPIYLATLSRRHLPPRTRAVMDFVIGITQRLRDGGRDDQPSFRSAH